MSHRPRCLQLLTAAALAAAPALSARADVSAPAILQMFDASWTNIERRAPDIFLAGYGGLWTPPPGRAETSDNSAGYDVYDRFDLGIPDDPTLCGTELRYKTQNAEMHKINVSVYSDLVWNHSGFSDNNTPGFAASGGYPGFVLNTPGTSSSDYHGNSDSGDFYMRVAGLLDIAQERNNQYVRNPVPGFGNNLPAGTTPLNGRLANVASENNRRFYPDLQGPSTTINGVTYYQWNTANPSTGDPVPENATGYLMRQARWMVEVMGVDGFRLDATKHVIDLSNGNPDWVLEFYDQAVNGANPRLNLDNSRKSVFSFGEYFDSNTATVQNSIRKQANVADRDALDFAMHYAVKNYLTNNGLTNDWGQIVNTTQDKQDDNLANNGSQGVAFDQSHDDGGAYLGTVANAYLMMRPGNAIIYFNAKEFGSSRTFPKDGRGDALGGLYGDAITKLVQIRNAYGRGNYQQHILEKETLIFEREKSAIAGFSNRMDGGYDERTFSTFFNQGTHLIELTGNATSSTVDPTNVIFDAVTVGAGGQVTIRVPRNKNVNNVEHGKGYVIYGPATPRGTLSFTNVDHTIAGETPTASTNGTARLASFDVIKTNSFEVQLQTDTFNLPDGYHDLDAEGDSAKVRFDGGLNINGNSGVDVTNPSDISYGFEGFLTEAHPRFGGGNGLFRQAVDATNLSEGFHYITARAYRHRDSGTGGDGGPAVFTDFRKVIYVDRELVQVTRQITGSGNTRNMIATSADMTASKVGMFLNTGASEYATQSAMLAAAYAQNNSYDRDSFRKTFDYINGNHRYAIVSFEPSYDPALGVAGGGVRIETFVGQMVTTGHGAGLGDLSGDNAYDTTDQTTFLNILGGASNPSNPNTAFNPAADLNADGLVTEADNVLMVPWLTYKGAGGTVINAAANNRLTRALVQTGNVLDVPSGTLDVSGTNVPAVPLTVGAAFAIDANKTLTKTGGETFTINGDQFHDTNATILTTGGTTNINTDGGETLAVNTSGAGSATNFGVTQRLRSVTVASGGVATLTTSSANNVNGHKAILTASLTADTGKLDLKNNNLAINYTGTSPLGSLVSGNYTGILGRLQAGSNHGVWNGANGITSSSADAMDGQTALAVAEASQVLGLTGSQTTTWNGVTVDATTILVKYSWGGDSNLDGLLNADDFFAIDSNYNKSPAGHSTGDFDYSGTIDGDDFYIIDSNYNSMLGTMPAPPLGAAGVQSVPEPTGATALLGAAALLARRSRKGNSPPSR